MDIGEKKIYTSSRCLTDIDAAVRVLIAFGKARSGYLARLKIERRANMADDINTDWFSDRLAASLTPIASKRAATGAAQTIAHPMALSHIIHLMPPSSSFLA
jgi:hypothetical protein